MSKIRTKLMIYKSKTLSDGTHPIVIRISSKDKRKYLMMGYSCKPNEWNEATNKFKANFHNHRKRNNILLKKYLDLESLIDDLRSKGERITLEKLKLLYENEKSQYVLAYFDKVYNDLIKAGKVGTASSYKETKSSLSKFTKNKDIKFHEINYSFLVRYELFLKESNVKENTISKRMRSLRAIFNRAIKEQVCRIEDYPFREYKVSKLDRTTTPRALTEDDILKIINYQPDNDTKEEDSRNLFLFSFYTMGMNFADIAKLQWSDIQNGRINYTRSKTGKPFTIKVNDKIQAIFDYFKAYHPNDKYIFPLLTKKHKTPLQQKNRITQSIASVNKHLKIIGKKLGIELALTTYVARHSWATILKRKGIATSKISEGLGHQSERQTQTYLDKFENSVLDEINENLL